MNFPNVVPMPGNVPKPPPVPPNRTRRGTKNAVDTTNKGPIRQDGTQMEAGPTRRRTGSVRRRPPSQGATVEKTTELDPQAQVTAIRQFALETVEASVQGLRTQFSELKAQTMAPPPRAAHEANPQKNRYKDVYCGDQSRVILAWPPGQPEYIHANWVPIVKAANPSRKFICTQGPMPNTTDDFWRMIFEHRCNAIIMLCGIMEQGRKKCEQYWPENSGETQTYGQVTVKATEINVPESTLIVTKLELTTTPASPNEPHVCVHYRWNQWPDRGVPDNYLACLRLLQKVRTHQTVVVHCSAGIGRTGTIVGLELAMERFRSGDRLKLADIVKELRTHRHGSVQTELQFVYMHRVLLIYAETKKAVRHEEIAAFFDAYDAYIKENPA